MLALGKIDGDELEGDLLLLEDSRDTLGAGGLRIAVESQDHFGCYFLGEVRKEIRDRRLRRVLVVSSSSLSTRYIYSG